MRSPISDELYSGLPEKEFIEIKPGIIQEIGLKISIDIRYWYKRWH
jgi:hypothetical protein